MKKLLLLLTFSLSSLPVSADSFGGGGGGQNPPRIQYNVEVKCKFAYGKTATITYQSLAHIKNLPSNLPYLRSIFDPKFFVNGEKISKVTARSSFFDSRRTIFVKSNTINAVFRVVSLGRGKEIIMNVDGLGSTINCEALTIRN